MNISIVDYGAGNIRSVARAITKLGHTPEITGDPQIVEASTAVILPGVGANDSAMRALHDRGLVEPLRKVINAGTPFFGVCLGMQLLLGSSEEGLLPSLGSVTGKVIKFPESNKVPHMGWNQVNIRGHHPVFQGVASGSNFYFVHSYYAVPENENVILGTTDYGVEFCSVLGIDSLIATQFHPEKSGAVGLRLYENFLSKMVEKRVR